MNVARFRNVAIGSGEGGFVCLWRCRLLSVPSGEQGSGLFRIAQAWVTWPEGTSTGTKWYSDVPGYPGW